MRLLDHFIEYLEEYHHIYIDLEVLKDYEEYVGDTLFYSCNEVLLDE